MVLNGIKWESTLGSLIGVCGIFFFLLIAWIFSTNRRQVDFRVIIGGLALQFGLAFFILKTSFGQQAFSWMTQLVASLISLSDEGARFVFGPNFADHLYAFKVLPTIIFVSSLSYILFYLGIIQHIIRVLAWVMVRVMNISGTESLVTAANVFLGQTEAPLFIRPYLKGMTKSELLTMMTGGMATVSGGILAAYVGLGINAGHLLAASVMAAPGAVLLARILHPETETSETKGDSHVKMIHLEDSNVFEAACNGASAGLTMALNVGAMLITFIALIAMLNQFLGWATSWMTTPLTLELILGTVFQPLAYLLGVSWEESFVIGELLGKKIVLNEFVAYASLSEYIQQGLLSERSVTIVTYALCGFANFSSIAVQIGGIGALEPSRKKDIAAFGIRALLGGTLAGMLTAAIAGLLI